MNNHPPPSTDSAERDTSNSKLPLYSLGVLSQKHVEDGNDIFCLNMGTLDTTGCTDYIQLGVKAMSDLMMRWEVIILQDQTLDLSMIENPSVDQKCSDAETKLRPSRSLRHQECEDRIHGHILEQLEKLYFYYRNIKLHELFKEFYVEGSVAVVEKAISSLSKTLSSMDDLFIEAKSRFYRRWDEIYQHSNSAEMDLLHDSCLQDYYIDCLSIRVNYHVKF